MRSVAVATVALLAAAAVWGCRAAGAGEAYAVRRDDLRITVESTGALRAVESTTISPPPIPNTWQYKIAFLAEQSAQVKQGEVIVSFDGSEMRRELEGKLAEREQASKEIQKKELELGARMLDLQRQLAESRAALRKAEMKVDVPESLVAANELERARLEVRKAAASIASYQAQLDYSERSGAAQLETLRSRRDRAAQRVRELEEGIGKMTIRAPRDGLIIQVENWRGERKRVGDAVSRYDQILQIPDLGRMEALAEIDEADAGRVRVGQPVTLRLEAHPDTEYTGTVAEISPTVSRQSWRSPLKVYRVLVALDETDRETMRPGMRFRAAIEVDRIEAALVIPLEAVTPRADGPVVHRASAPADSPLPVQLGARAGDRIEVLGGLQEGDVILRRSASRRHGR